MTRHSKYLILALITLISCTRVEFTEVSPQKGKKITEVPVELVGSYINLQFKDTLIITSSAFKYCPAEMSGSEFVNLNDGNIILKKFNNYHLLNIYNAEADTWVVFPFTYTPDKIIVYDFFLDGDEDDPGEAELYRDLKAQQLASITDVLHTRDTIHRVDTYVINPTDKEMKTILASGLYVPFEFIRIK